jgi:hypothetical protein
LKPNPNERRTTAAAGAKVLDRSAIRSHYAITMLRAYLPTMWISTPADALVVVDVVLSSA